MTSGYDPNREDETDVEASKRAEAQRREQARRSIERRSNPLASTPTTEARGHASPTPSEVAILRGVLGHTQREAAEVIHCDEREWEHWEVGERQMHPGLWELFRLKTRRRIDDAAKNARMLLPKMTRQIDGMLEYEYPQGTEPIRAETWAALAAKIVERMRADYTQRDGRHSREDLQIKRLGLTVPADDPMLSGIKAHEESMAAFAQQKVAEARARRLGTNASRDPELSPSVASTTPQKPDSQS